MHHRSLLVRLSLAAALLSGLGAAQAVATPFSGIAVVVPGDANPWLAGMPDGTGASLTDAAPAQSPVLVPGLSLVAGTAVQFLNVTGGVSYSGSCPADCIGPDGDVLMSHGFDFNTRINFGFGAGENGIAVLAAPLSGLLGVYLDASQPDGTPVPATILDFQAGALGLNFTSLSPGLKQVFFIGDGMTDGGTVQSFIVPTGATRLYLGTMDGFGWAGNNGAFALDVSAVPEPANALLALAGLGWLLGYGRRANRRGIAKAPASVGA